MPFAWMRLQPRHLLVGAVCLQLLTCATVSGQCKPSDPVGRYEGSGTSGQAGKVDVSLNLSCVSGNYAGTLDSPLGPYLVTAGAFEAGTLKLVVTHDGDNIAIEVKVSGDGMSGSFHSKDDEGPVELHRTGDAAPTTTPLPTNTDPNPAANDSSTSLTPQQWRDDLAFLAKELSKRHPDAFANTSKEKFDAAVAELSARIEHLNSDEIYIGLDHLANLIGDAHTYVQFPAGSANLPLDIRRFGNDSRIRVVAVGYEKALGTRVIAINGVPTGHAQELASTATPIAETPSLIDSRVDAMLTTGMALHGLEITPDRNSARYTLASDDGKPFDVTFTALLPAAPEPKWLNVNNSIAEQPVKGSAGCTYLSDPRTLFCKVLMIRDLAEPSKQMLETIKQEHPEKVVIDLRENGGGDYNIGLKYLIEPLAKNSDINKKGHLFVLIGRDTFSAAMSNAAQFRRMTQATLVGQSIGERPNSYQEPRQFVLPNSHFIVRYSTKLYKFGDGSENVIAPDKEIIPTWDAYKNGHDEVLDWVIAAK